MREKTLAKDSHQDDGFTLLSVSRNVRLPNSEEALTGRLPANARFIPYSEEIFTAHASVPAEVTEAGFALFQSSLDDAEEVSRDATSTSAFNGNTDLNIDCEDGQEGVVSWYPLGTIYQGSFTPSGDRVDISIPDNSTSGTMLGVRCFD